MPSIHPSIPSCLMIQKTDRETHQGVFQCTYMSVRVCYVPICLFCLYDLCMCTCICLRLDRWKDEIFESVHMRGGQREIRPYAYILVYTYIRNDLFDMRTHTRLYTGDTARFD